MFISGVTGPSASSINGLYSPTQERGTDGRVIYVKSGGSPMYIEHSEGAWQVRCDKKKSFRAEGCCAGVPGGCALEACASHVWKVGDNVEHRDQPGVTMLIGAEAERAVSGSWQKSNLR